MDRYFWVKWKDSKKCEHVVGILCSVNNKYYFRYNPEFKNDENVPQGFNGVPSFGRIKDLTPEQKEKTFAIKSSNQLFEFFKMRVISKFEKEIWKSYGLEEYDECELLSLTKGKLSTDTFFVEEMDMETVKEVQEDYPEEKDFFADR